MTTHPEVPQAPTKWYGRLHNTKPRGAAQIEEPLAEAARSRKFTLPEHVLRLAHREYEHQYGHSQDYERMQERGGLGVLEVVALLADLAERHGATPTDPRPPS